MGKHGEEIPEEDKGVIVSPVRAETFSVDG